MTEPTWAALGSEGMGRREAFDARLLNDKTGYWKGTESEIERWLQYCILKHLAESDAPILDEDPPQTTYGGLLVPQVEIRTRFGAYRMDFVLHSKGLNTMIECDGGAFHGNVIADELRSALILETGLVDQVIRFNGVMIHHAAYDAAMFACLVHRAAFGPPAERLLAFKATPQGREAAARAVGKSFAINYVVNMVREAGETEDDMAGGTPLPRDFQLRYHHQASSQGRIARFLAILEVASPRTKQELERQYWDTLEAPDSPLARRVDVVLRRKREMLSDSLDRAAFYQCWDRLAGRFEDEGQDGSTEEYYKAVSAHLSKAQFIRACRAAFRRDASFPTVERLRALAADDSDLLGDSEAPAS